MSIRGRLFVLVLGAAIPLSIVGAAALRGMWRVSRSQVDDSIKQQAQLASTAFERWLDAQRQPLTTIAAALADRNFDKATLNDYLHYVVQPRPQWIDLRVIDASGANVAVEPSGKQAIPPALVSYLSAEIQRRNSPVMVTDRTGSESSTVFAIATPVKSGGAVIARIDGAAVQELFSHIELHDQAVIAIFDENGQILFRKTTTQASPGEEVNFSPLISALGNRQFAVTEVESPYDGVRRIYGLARTGKGTGPVAVVGIPSATLYQSANRRFLTYVLFSLLALACALVAALLIARRIIGPLRHLQQAARDLGSGERKVRAPVAGTTETRELGAAFNSMAAQIAEREERLQELDVLKSEFVSSVSHELRTPLTTIKTLTHVLQQRSTSAAERREYLQTIAEECDRQIDLVVNLLDLSRIESGAFSVSCLPVDLAEVVASCVTRQQHAANVRSQTLRPDLPADTPPVRADKSVLSRVVCSLIENAIKYTPDGGQITVGVVPKNDELALYVSDTGYGISNEDIPRVFDKFFRGHLARNDNQLTESSFQSGVGLGLYLARKMVEQMRGRLEVRSTGSEGTTFTIILPRWSERDFDLEIGREEERIVEKVTSSR